MEYGKIIAITGMPGLYEMLGSKGDGAIVRSLEDKSTKFVSGRVHNFTHLESIEVYTQKENVNLVEVLNAMKSSAEKLPNEKDGKAITAYFQKVFPQLDFERVYSSDMKKMIKWYIVLQNNNVELKITETEPEAEPVVTPEPEEEKPAKETKSAKKPAKAASENKKPEEAKEDSGEKKKPAAKKAAAKKEEPEEKQASKKAAPAKKAAKKK